MKESWKVLNISDIIYFVNGNSNGNACDEINIDKGWIQDI